MFALTTGPAHASIPAASLIDGPSASIVSLDGVAMAADGTGGLVYTKKTDTGKTHIFASRFVAGAWTPPQQVDVGQAYNSTWPQIGAGDGGRLVVTWVQEYGADVQDRMYSASLDPGATRFQAPIPIDLNVGDGSDIWPSLSMNAGGQAYLTYRVIYSRSNPNLPPGYVDADVRVARYDGAFWSLLGQPIDRNASQPVATPTATNGPKIATDINGNAVVVWQEPDDDFIDRVYARRLFGGVLGNVLQVSPGTIGTTPLRGAADQFTVDVSPFGEAVVAFRQQPGPDGTPYTRPRAMVNVLPSALTATGNAFLGAKTVDGAGDDGPVGALGPVDAAVDDAGDYLAAFGVDHRSLAATGTETSADAPAQIDDGTSDVAGDPVVDLSQDGAYAAAWKVDQGGSAAVSIREHRADGLDVDQEVSATYGGALNTLLLSGSGLGDAAVAFLQGDGAGTQIAAADVDAPPGAFSVATPPTWTRDADIPITWDAAPHAIGGISYSLQVDGSDVADNLKGTSFTLTPKLVDDGQHDVQVVATDAGGQTTTSIPSTLEVDRTRPKIKLTRIAHGVRFTVADGAKGDASGVALSQTSATFGDGGKALKGHKAARHLFRRAGTYTVRIKTADHAGNTRTLTRKVRVR